MAIAPSPPTRLSGPQLSEKGRNDSIGPTQFQPHPFDFSQQFLSHHHLKSPILHNVSLCKSAQPLYGPRPPSCTVPEANWVCEQHKTKDIVTLFHKASSPASVRVASLLKQTSANATEHATEDQASDHSAQTDPHRAEFELNITEDAPTPDQLQTILEYVGKPAIPSIVKGASSESEAMKLFKKSAENFQRPVVRFPFCCLFNSDPATPCLLGKVG